MRVPRSAMLFARLAVIVVATAAMIQCSSTTPGDTTLSVANVTLNATSIGAGTNGQGTISLTGRALNGGASIALSSSNPAIATVQPSVIAPAGSSSVTFPVTALATGTTTITASLNGGSRQSPTLTVVVGTVTLSSISLNPSSVIGGDWSTGTATLSSAAPSGGAIVALSGSDPATVPPNVNVPAGSTSATFAISTRPVGSPTTSTISGSYGGTSASVTLSVTRSTIAIANFGVTGPTESETCTMTNNGNTLNCTFNGGTSVAPGTITAWDWTYGMAATFSQTTSGPILTMPAVDCSLMPPPPLPAGGVPWFTMTVTLKIHDDLGNVSAVFKDAGVRLIPQGVCGF